MALASLPVALIAGEWDALAPLLITAVASLIPGQALFRAYRRAPVMRLRHAMVTTVLSWTLVPLIGMLPLLLIGQGAADGSAAAVLGNGWNAFFESMSGFTSTGLSLVERPSDLPATLQWWRSFSQWVGGVGVVLVMLAVFHPSGDAHRLYFSEAHGTTILPDLAATVRTIGWIYAGYTCAAVAALWLTDLPPWEALNYGLTGIATGGFSVTDDGMAGYGPAPRVAMIVIMIAGAISFATHFRLLTQGRIGLLWRDPENRALGVLIVVGAVLIIGENAWAGTAAGLIDGVFQWVSALATAGFSTVDLSVWSPTALLLMVAAMVCGGAAGATTGGIKLRRVILLAAAALGRVRGLALHPWRLMEHKPIVSAEDEVHAVRTLEAAMVMLALWMASLFLGSLLLLHSVPPAVPLEHVIFEVASALGNVGLSTGIAGPELHWSGKLYLIVAMWVGRLEIVPVLVLIAALIAQRRAARSQK